MAPRRAARLHPRMVFGARRLCRNAGRVAAGRARRGGAADSRGCANRPGVAHAKRGRGRSPGRSGGRRADSGPDGNAGGGRDGSDGRREAARRPAAERCDRVLPARGAAVGHCGRRPERDPARYHDWPTGVTDRASVSLDVRVRELYARGSHPRSRASPAGRSATSCCSCSSSSRACSSSSRSSRSSWA